MNRLLPAMVALLAATAIAAACGSGSRPSATPTPAPATFETPSTAVPASTVVSPPPAAPPTPGPVLRTSGWAVYTRGADLYLGSLDGKTERPLTEGAYARCGNTAGGCRSSSWYAGESSSNGQRWLYYIKALGPLDPQEFALPALHYALERRPFDGGSEQELVRFDGFDANANSRGEVSPDGRSVAYGALDGVRRFEVATRENALLAPNDTSCSRKGGMSNRCDISSDPRWSPDGKTLVLKESFFEGSVAAFLDMSTPGAKPSALDEGLGGHYARWSPDGSQLCISETGYDLGGGGLLAAADRAFRNLTAALGGGRAVALDCGWSDDGSRVAFTLERGSAGGGLAIFSADGSLERETALPYSGLQVGGWLPDGRGVVVWWAVGEETPRAAGVILDGTTRSLPFDADVVQAVLASD